MSTRSDDQDGRTTVDLEAVGVMARGIDHLQDSAQLRRHAATTLRALAAEVATLREGRGTSFDRDLTTARAAMDENTTRSSNQPSAAVRADVVDVHHAVVVDAHHAVMRVGPGFKPLQPQYAAEHQQRIAHALKLIEEAQARLCADPGHDVALAAALEQARRILTQR